MIRRIAITLTLLLMTLDPAQLAADIVIDNFTQGSPLSRVTAGSVSQSTNHPSILGGTRESTLTVPNLGGSELFGVLGFGNGLQIAQGTSDQIQGALTYQNFGTIDLTEASGNTNFALSITQNGAVQAINDVFWVSVGSGGSNTQVFFDIPAVGSSWVQVDFADFVGVDLTAVDSIQLGFDFATVPGGEVTINQFLATQGVPEPGMAGISMILLAAIAMRRRRLA